MKIVKLSDEYKPSFCWDRDWTCGEIHRRLREARGNEWTRLVSWIMREGTVNEVWNFVKPSEVYRVLDGLLPFLGRKKEYWSFTFDLWHRLGKV